MVARLDTSRQFTIVNAPAGSGKTTAIYHEINNLLAETKKQILCITYTNRAADQLKNTIISDKVKIGTIHSFISEFMSTFFKINEVIELYLEVFKHNISEEIKNLTKEKEDIYKEKFKMANNESVDLNVVKNNLKLIEYNELQYSRWLYGGLSHNDLLIFSREALKKFPKIGRSLSFKFSHIFIDEYQDTHASILSMFYDAIKDSQSKLILLGDKMQQIYSDRVEDFMHIIESEFNEDLSLSNNWRSQAAIVDLLNNIYFDSKYIQNPMRERGKKAEFNIIEEINLVENKEVLQLVLLNSVLFDSIGSLNLFNAFKLKYNHFNKISPKEVLSDPTIDNPDELMQLFLFLIKICELFEQGNYGKLIQVMKRFKYINNDFFVIKHHTDKKIIRENIENLSKKINEPNLVIEELIDYIVSENLFEKNYIQMVLEKIYDTNEKVPGFRNQIYELQFNEVKNCYLKMKQPTISTQHAVKGEGHDNVYLYLEDYHNPNVQMYTFMELFSRGLFNFKIIENIVMEGKRQKRIFEEKYDIQMSKFKKENFDILRDDCNDFANKLIQIYRISPDLYNFLMRDKVEAFNKSATVTKFKDLIKLINKLEGVLIAYKLFYVGCSRAKDNLTVFVKRDNVAVFKLELIEKMKSVGFIVSD